MAIILFIAVLFGGLFCGAWVSRWRERRVRPIWTWGGCFAALWTSVLVYAGATNFGGAVWLWGVAGALGFFVSFMACVVAAMTAGRGKVSKS